MMPDLRVSSPVFLGREREYVNDCLDRGELSWRGAYVERFEREFAAFCGVRYAVSCCNGTAGLHLALLALGVGHDDFVFLPALTYVATANAVRYVGATPVFCDVEADTWCLDPEDVARRMRGLPVHRLSGGRSEWRRGVILPVHLYGVPANMTRLTNLAASAGFKVVEDACEAHGATVDCRRVGGLGDVGVFSFFASKLLSTGEGGMLTTNDEATAAKLRHLRGQGQSSQYFHDIVGYNYRLTNIQAAISVAQLETYATHAARRAEICHHYRRALFGFECQATPPGYQSADWLFVVLVPERSDRDAVMARMAAVGIETRPTFPPLTSMPMYAGSAAWPVLGTLPNTLRVSARGVCLPTHGALTDEDVDRVVFEFLEAL